MVFKISEVQLLQFLLLVLPFVDTLNGYLNNGANESGLSFGIVYRIIILTWCIFLLLRHGMLKQDFFSMVLIIFGVVLSFFSSHSSEYFVLLSKLLLPILLIFVFKIYTFKGVLPNTFFEKIFSWWNLLFVLSILIPFFLGIGFRTYGEGSVGFKGFYYSQNDLGIVLILLFAYSLIRISRHFSLINLFLTMSSLFCGILLGLKSVYIIDFVLIIYFMYSKRLTVTNMIKNVMYTILGFFAVYGFYIWFFEDINGIIKRWEYFLNQSESFFSFFTSSRIDRIPRVFSWLSETNYRGLIFGTGLEYTKITSNFISSIQIEMDFFDILFQLGIVGLLGVLSVYFQTVKSSPAPKIYQFIFVIACCYSFFVGHVLESALSGMVFATFVGLILEKGQNENVDKNAVY